MPHLSRRSFFATFATSTLSGLLFKDGEIQLPPGPGLGLDINEEAAERYRVRRA